jgi:hypothetical protein
VDESPRDSASTSGSNITAIILKWIVQLVAVAIGVLIVTAVVLYVELGDPLVVSYQGGWGGWTRYCIYGGWFGFALIRIVILFLLLFIARALWRWSRNVGRPLATLIILGLLTFLVMTWYSPAGIYGVVDRIEDPFDHYFVFAGGKVEFVRQPYFFILGEKVDAPQNAKMEWGRYEKTANGWIMTETGEHGSRYRLQSSWLGIRLINLETPESQMIWGRRLIPWLRPDWMPDWLQ